MNHTTQEREDIRANDNPVPNWLRYFGLDLGTSRMRVSSLTLAE